MKASELMIGDYARVNRDGLCIKKGSVVVIRGIDADDKLEDKGLVGAAHCHPLDEEQFDGGIWCDYLDPIPLTPEILENNEFIPATNGVSWCLRDDDTDECLLMLNKIHNAFVMSTAGMTIGFQHVHQLQHLLRLCGIKKEITLN